MPDIKSTDVRGQLSVVRCLAGANMQPESDEAPWPYEVDKNMGKFYYLINRASTQHLRKDQYLC